MQQDEEARWFPNSIKILFIVVGLLLPLEKLLAHDAYCDANPNNFSGVIRYDISSNNSYCELCGEGWVTIVVTNPSHVNMADFVVTHNFLSTQLEYVPNTTTVNGSATGNPVISGGGQILTWTPTQMPALNSLAGTNSWWDHNYNRHTIRFQVRSRSGFEENLVNVARNVRATTNYRYCPTAENTAGSAQHEVVLPIHEPYPVVRKYGRNIDAAQNNWRSTVYGNIDDDVIWRIQIQNYGNADLQDLKFDDLMQNGNFQINYACPTLGQANSIAFADGGGPLNQCVPASNNINNFAVDDPFGNPRNDEPGTYIDVYDRSRSAYIFLVGKITNSCNANTRNIVSNVEWGCEVDSPDGGIDQMSTGYSPGEPSTTLSSRVQTGGLQVQRELTGLNTAQPVGSRGLMTITMTNNSGGSIKNIHLRNVLPTQYVVDSTFTPTINITPQFGNYDGMIDQVFWTNPAAPGAPLTNTAPEYDLLSSTVHPDHADQRNMLRHGDVAVVTFRVVMIPPAFFDKNADLDVREEIIADTTDPDNARTLNNQLTVTYENFCSPGTNTLGAYNDTFPSNPEDLDIDISGTELVFILTNDPAQALPLQVALTNRGGHYADDYHAYVSFGTTMEVISSPANCALTSNPPLLEVWDDPVDIPITAAVYECSNREFGSDTGLGTIQPGQTRLLNFEVIKTSDPGRLAEDDLTFRADVVGETTLSDGTLLTFPTPSVTPIVNRANNYSLDGIRARILGFNLLKSQFGNCTENNPPPASPDDQVQIGEECSVYIETGGWFGFLTPGFTYIAVQRIQVDDELPDGQGYISSTDPVLTSDPTILGISLNPPALAPLDEVTFNWTFNQVVPVERITVKDQWFRTYATTRILNDPIDSSAAPNQHAARSRNVLNSTFEAVFDNAGTEEVYTLGPGTIGYPNEPIRRVDLRVTEPNITVLKEVCNETLYGVGTGCSNFVTLADDGDTQDSYIYRITLTNEASSGGYDRAPAYDIISTDVLDASDLVLVVPFASDGLDNDADGLIDSADLDGEGSISDNVISNVTPAVITFSHTHSTGLLRINAGANVVFYYRVDPDDAVAPLQQLTNSVTATYDSLAGATGNQTVVPRPNSDIGGARVYNMPAATATVQILPIQTQPKVIIDLSNTVLAGSPQSVSIGEEIEYRLRAFLPVANLRDFAIRDELPAGISCIEAPDINLDAAPYSDAGFVPGGIFTPVCTNNLVTWNFGDQELTTAPSNSLFEFPVSFIARVDNTPGVNDGDELNNGVPGGTVVFVSYRNEANALVTQDFGRVGVRIREPNIVLTKTYESAVNDASDIITVTVTANNNGNANAYNLRVLDDLAAVSNLTYLGNVAGVDPPDAVDVGTLGINRPIFSWNSANPDFAIAPSETKSFTFDIRVDIGAQPHEILDDTIQASWTSLPSQATSLNSSNAIGPDGSATGMRIGVLPNNPVDLVNDYETTATTSATVPALTLSKNDLNPGLLPEIGAHKNFEIVIGLPEGTTNNLTVTDALNNAGISYFLSHNPSFEITYSFTDIATINGLAPAESAFTAAAPVDNTSGNAVWTIGTVVTASEDDTVPTPSINPSIRINYYARINNDLVTDSGDNLQNSVTVNYNNGETAAVESLVDTTPVVNVTESVLGVSKTATLITPAPITGGDVIEYAISIPNTGNAVAYDVNVVDTLPTDLQLDATFTATATIGGIPVAGFVSAPSGAPAGPLVWGGGNADDSLDIPAGSTLVLTYRTRVQSGAQSGIDLSNSVMVDWTSLDGTSIYERTGTGCPTTTAPNDYCVGPATSTVTTGDNNSLDKSVIADTYPPANDASLRVGDTVTYQLSLNLQEGTTRSVSVQDVLPAGLSFVDIVSINGDSTADYTPPGVGAGSNYSYAPITAAALPTGGQTGNLTFTLGDVVNDPFGDPTTDTLIIVYRAEVLTNILPHVPATTLTNTATLSYIDGIGAPVVDPARLEDSASIVVWQPVMTVPDKTDRSGRTSTANVLVGVDVMNFRLSSCNTTGLAPAYSLQVTDQLSTQLDQASIEGPVNGVGVPDVYINGALVAAGVDYIYTAPVARGGFMLFEFIAPVGIGQCVDIDYDIGFYTDFGSNQFWDNTVVVDEYWSLPLESGQQYAPLGPTTFTMHNNAPFVPPSKVMLSPVSDEATIGEEIVYRITLPASNAARYDVVISDMLHPSLEFISASEANNNFTLADNTVPPGNVSIGIDLIPAAQVAVIDILARIANNTNANAGASFTNTATYSYANSDGGPLILGGTTVTPDTLTLIEPFLVINKTVANVTDPGNPPTSGDILRYSITLTASGGVANDNYADVFDVSIVDNLSLGLAYITTTSSVDGANTISDPSVVGDGAALAQTLNWNLSAANADIDVVEGTTVTVNYDVRVLDDVLANQTLTNTASAQWTGLDGINTDERTGTATPAVNDYFTATVGTSVTTPDGTSLTKTRNSDTYGGLDANLRIGDIVEYELQIALQEGRYNNVIVTDTLPQGLIFEGVVQINGDTSSPYSAVTPFTHADVAITTSGDPNTGPSTVTYTIGDLVNLGDNNPANNDFVITYLARVLDTVHPQVNNITLTNNARVDYDTGTGTAFQTSSTNVTVLQPVLSITKSAVANGGDTVVVADEIVTYTVDVINSGTAPAYDLVLEDIIPSGMRNGTATISMDSITLLGSGTVLPNLIPTYNATTGLAVWNFDTGVANAYTIPAAETLRIIYQVQTDANLGAGLVLTNQAVARLYYSFDDEAVPTVGGVTGVREIYGPSNTGITTLTTETPGALDKQNPADVTVSIGETFSYQITVPAIPLSIALHDVRILDDLAASAADLTFISVSKVGGSEPWVPVNTGTATSLVIEDTTNGIDIPAGEQVVMAISVQVADTVTNVSGLTFTNTASYTYNQLPNDNGSQQPGGPDTTLNMTIVGPDSLTLEKNGPVEIRTNLAETFTLNVHNTGSAPAWDITVTDLIPSFAPAVGGMCDTTPNNITARIFLADGVTPVSAPLIENTDFVVNFTGEPGCTLSITTTSAAAALPEDNRLIITYQAEIDQDTLGAVALTNIAGATEWFSADTPGTGPTGSTRTYTRVITDGTVAILDHEDAHTTLSKTATLYVQKSVINMSTAQNPGSDAQPGHTLRYRIYIENLTDVPVPEFNFVDDLGGLNAAQIFVAGSLNLITVPVGADISNTDVNGGVNSTGLLDIRNMTLDIAGSGNEFAVIEFDITLLATINNGTVVLNQGHMFIHSRDLPTDDPNVNGIDDPYVVGGEDPTETLIASAPSFRVEKISTDLTGDPNILLSGDTLRYTITVKNSGTENAINTVLRDQLPANTTYIAGSTRLNGIAVAEPTPGVLPLQAGILINAAENTTAGVMRADASATLANVATIIFDVQINNNVVNGTIISNQGFINAQRNGGGAIPEQASDDPATPAANDPTRDVVGNQPLVDAHKTVSIVVDNGTPGILDPGDTLRYSINISNIGASSATGVVFIDGVPANTAYVTDTVTLNGLPVGQPDAGVSPLITGIDVSSSDLTPPLPTSGNGTLSAGGNALITFDVEVNAAVASGTVISNQGSVSNNELPTELTDADGIDSNGDQPTTIVVGNAQLLSITKDVAVVGGGAATSTGQLEYRVRVTNISSVPASNVVITDNLDVPVAGQLNYVAASGLLNGLAAGVSFAAPIISADYSTTYGDLLPGETAELRFLANINSLPIGTTITNVADVSWNAGTQTDNASISIDVGGTPGVANLNGSLWHDANFDNVFDPAEQALNGWNIDVYRGATLLGTVNSDANGEYQINGLLPNNIGGDLYELRFRAPGAGSNTALLGLADSAFTDDLQRIHTITVSSGSNTQNLNLPIDPNGVVYNSVVRTPIAGTTLRLLNATTSAALPASCFADGNQQGQVTLANGYYKFDIDFSPSSCPTGADYLIEMTPPGSGYNPVPSVVITPQTDASTPALDVASCPGGAADAIPATTDYCEAQSSEFAPTLAVPPGSVGTNYYLRITLSDVLVPQDSQLFNNHLPIDPELSNAVSISKTSALTNVTRGQLVPYTITVNNTLTVALNDSDIIDNYPAGFKYVPGSARFNNGVTEVPLEPSINGLQLTWSNIDLPVDQTQTIKLLLIVGAAVNEGEYINRAQVFDTLTSTNASGVASATVRVIPDPAFDCSDVIGKVFDDVNYNGYQDENELGLAGVRVITARGLVASTDEHGRFHLTCAVVPDASRGSNFIMKLDERSLPSGYRVTNENPRVQRATRGKMLKFNFGAGIHRVVSLDIADGIFKTNSTEIRPQWKPRVNLLIEQLNAAPSILRLSYLADIEETGLVEDRLDALKQEIIEKWQLLDSYQLSIETEIFWRRGAPPDRGDIN